MTAQSAQQTLAQIAANVRFPPKAAYAALMIDDCIGLIVLKNSKIGSW